jgi:hypothetical protein
LRLFKDLAIVKYSRCDQPNKIFALKFINCELPSIELMASHENIQASLLEENKWSTEAESLLTRMKQTTG